MVHVSTRCSRQAAAPPLRRDKSHPIVLSDLSDSEDEPNDLATPQVDRPSQTNQSTSTAQGPRLPTLEHDYTSFNKPSTTFREPVNRNAPRSSQSTSASGREAQQAANVAHSKTSMTSSTHSSVPSMQRPPSKPSSSVYDAFHKSSTRFPSSQPAVATQSGLHVPKASPFYQPPPTKPSIPGNHWMMSQVQSHNALQRQNVRDPRETIYIPKSTTLVKDEDAGENFTSALNNLRMEASDYDKVAAEKADSEMRELLSGAIGDGEDDVDGNEEDDKHVEGFASGMSLMPHQVRGVKWMTGRESGKKNGGILADVSQSMREWIIFHCFEKLTILLASRTWV